MKVQIQADGTPRGTRVLDEIGQPLAGVSAVKFEHHANMPPTAHIELFLPDVSVVGIDARIYGPNGKVVKKVTYDDGTEVEY